MHMQNADDELSDLLESLQNEVLVKITERRQRKLLYIIVSC